VKGIDIFITVDPKKHSHVVFAGSSIKCDNGSIGKYEFLYDTNEDTLITGTLQDVMNNAEIELIGVEPLNLTSALAGSNMDAVIDNICTPKDKKATKTPTKTAAKKPATKPATKPAAKSPKTKSVDPNTLARETEQDEIPEPQTFEPETSQQLAVAIKNVILACPEASIHATTQGYEEIALFHLFQAYNTLGVNTDEIFDEILEATVLTQNATKHFLKEKRNNEDKKSSIFTLISKLKEIAPADSYKSLSVLLAIISNGSTNSIDFSDQFVFNDMIKTRYYAFDDRTKINRHKLLSDLQRVMINCGPAWGFKRTNEC
jgi:ribosomal protein L12E/L44/L45/RPP1/RPP2